LEEKDLWLIRQKRKTLAITMAWWMVSFLLFLCCSVKSSEQVFGVGDSSVNRPTALLRPGTAIPPPFSSTQRALPAIKVEPSGRVYTTQILKQQLANELGLPLRDLRIVDPSYPNQIQATFTSRKKAILFCIENIKVVVQHNEALIFSPYQQEVQEFVPALQQQIAQAAANDEAAGTAGSLRFEHIVIEAALNVVCTNLFRRVRAISPAVASALTGLRAESRGLEVLKTQVDELLPLKNKIDELRKRVKEIKRAITEVLNNDEDLQMMYLCDPINSTLADSLPTDSKIVSITDGTEEVGMSMSMSMSSNVVGDNCPVAVASSLVADTTNVEMLFENYLNEIEWISSEVEDVVDEITNTEESVSLQLEVQTNRILRLEAQLSIASFVVTCGALVTGLFGMNLLSHMETDTRVFYFVSFVITGGMTSLWLALTRYGRRERLF
jgi:magnesium transporter